MHRIGVLCETDSFVAKGEVYNNLLFLHCEVKKNTKSALKEILSGLEILKEEAYLAGWDEMYTYTQNPRWVRLLGGIYLTEIVIDEKRYEVYKWELKH